MVIPLHCSACGSLIKIGDEFAGRKVRCPRCQAVMQAPAASPPPPAAVATAIAEITEVEPLPETPPSRAAFTARPQERPRDVAAVAGVPAADANGGPPPRRASSRDHDDEALDERGGSF